VLGGFDLILWLDSFLVRYHHFRYHCLHSHRCHVHKATGTRLGKPTNMDTVFLVSIGDDIAIAIESQNQIAASFVVACEIGLAIC
jgi:hypothetical protein